MIPGDVVAVSLGPGPAWFDLVGETWAAGAALLPIDHRLPPREAGALPAAPRPRRPPPPPPAGGPPPGAPPADRPARRRRGAADRGGGRRSRDRPDRPHERDGRGAEVRPVRPPGDRRGGRVLGVGGRG